MKTHVTFRSDAFPPLAGEEEGINPGVWGRRLAEFLAARLSEHGVETDAPIAEDWGWYLPVRADGVRLGLCCGHQDGDDDEFLCFTDPARPIVKRLFKKIDVTSELVRLTTALDQVLAADASIRDIVWSEPGERG